MISEIYFIAAVGPRLLVLFDCKRETIEIANLVLNKLQFVFGTCNHEVFFKKKCIVQGKHEESSAQLMMY